MWVAYSKGVMDKKITYQIIANIRCWCPCFFFLLFYLFEYARFFPLVWTMPDTQKLHVYVNPTFMGNLVEDVVVIVSNERDTRKIQLRSTHFGTTSNWEWITYVAFFTQVVSTNIGICTEGGFTLGSTTNKTPKAPIPNGREQKIGPEEFILGLFPMCAKMNWPSLGSPHSKKYS